jgi:exopolysaccharide/PEP-CTERM locus tyrosine autokinase
MIGGAMSKIYKALEKAERERKEGLKERAPVTQESEEERIERHEITREPQKGEGISFDSKMISLVQSGSLAAEQFRKLRTYLLRFKIYDVPKTIMITSATSGEGKTFVAANLAISISRELRTHALVVDCDLRNPTLTQRFGLPNGKGLSDYLVGNGNLSDFFLKTEVEKLNLLPSGSIQENPTELIGSKKMEALIHELKSRYPDRYVIFDSTPLLATTEPEVLAKLVDGIVVVVRAGATPRETVKQAIANLDKGKILGFVLNYLEFKYHGQSSRYFGSDGYYYKNGHGYRYGYGKSKAIPPQGPWGKLLRFMRKSD